MLLLRSAIATVLLCATICATSAADEPVERSAVDAMRLNQLQFVGTHNSYHVRPPEKALKAAISLRSEAREWDYTHAPLDVQLDRGVRSFELDLHYKQGEFGVFHVPVLDFGSTCPKLTDAFSTVRAWSDKHPDHLPISFLCELKTEGPSLDRNIKEIDAEGFDKLDAAIRAAFPDKHLLTPDDVRGDEESLRAAVNKQGWPKVADCRGRVFFILHDVGRKRYLYTAGHPSQRGRAMFVRSDDSRDDCATMVLDGATDPLIPKMVDRGYFVRTRADSGLKGDTPGKPSKRDKAFASGAHIVSTDFPTGESQAETGYTVEFAGGAPARVNPVNGPEAVRGKPVSK
jgi:hypothetical protein